MTAKAAKTSSGSILVVDDEPIVLQSVAEYFREEGYQVDAAENAEEASRLIGTRSYDVAFVDIRMPGADGISLLGKLSAEHPELPVIIMTAYASVESAVKALKAGAYDYIAKPFDPEELSHLVRRAIEHRALKSENVRLKERLEVAAAPPPIIGSSPAMKRVLELVDSVSDTDSTVLIRGESGTGKELVARAIHAGSSRRYGPLVVVNCGALAEGILESELFGHEKGAFTGAHDRRIGRFEAAAGGTIFLDEIASVSGRVQVELLRVLEEKVVTRLGARDPIGVDFRAIAATNQDLEAMVRRGDFREDLFWRLNVVTIELPPLRDRADDAMLLAEYFLARYAKAMNRRAMNLSSEAEQAIRSYAWPGNARELQNAIERAVVFGSPPVIKVEDLSLRTTEGFGQPAPRSLASAEKVHVQRILDSCGWNISRAARILEVDRGTLYNKIARYGIRDPRGKSAKG